MIVVSHRGPFTFTEEPDGSLARRPGAGGVASALAPLLARRSGTRWIAAAIGDGDREAAAAGPQTVDGIELHLLALEPRLHRRHYDVVSNATLWFLHHGLFDLPRRPRFDARFREAWQAYEQVNAAFADEICACAAPGEIVLVQDYQLAMVPALARACRPDLRATLFQHTPFCGPQSVRVLPEYASGALLGAMASVPVGFHTQRWARAYEASAREILGDDHPIEPAFWASLGPDVEMLRAMTATPDAVAARDRFAAVVGERQVILRTDRIEPSKNIVRGFLSFDLLLEERPEWRDRVVFLALLYASRETLAEYQWYRREVVQAAESVNRRWATPSWQPIVLETDDDFARSLAGMQRYDVLLVNPVKDGLNLVAKEGPLLNERDGVLCLSREAGAYAELGEAALPLHPYDLEQCAATLHAALTMTPAERSAHATRVRELAASRDPSRWLADLMAQAGGEG
ncbi:MAG: trehalose-6-phosphate synthase [Acidimicrobiia bacterium]